MDFVELTRLLIITNTAATQIKEVSIGPSGNTWSDLGE